MYIYNSLCLHIIYILRGLMPTTAAIKGCYSNCVWWSDPLSLKLNTPHPEQLIKEMIVRGLKPSTAVIKGCYSNCARWSDPFQLNTPSQTINRIRHCKRAEARRSRHQRMLLQLRMVISPPAPLNLKCYEVSKY